LQWIKRFIFFHGKRHPLELDRSHIESFLSHLAVDRNVAASTQNQALNALVFLYREVLKMEFGWLGDVEALADADLASTTVTMDDSYSVTANFETVGGGCFIATAAYDTPVAEDIQILREFRDVYLLTNPLGRAFVHFYYTVSPPIAEFISRHAILKLAVRAMLIPAVAMSSLAIGATQAQS